jgi:MFS family permease
MTRLASPSPPSRHHRRPSQPCTETQQRPVAPHLGYDRPFWLAYASNLLVVVAIALLYRYADFIRLLGGTEFHLGWIVGVGMIGSLLMRLMLGSCIDSYGTKMVWLASSLLFSACCFAHLSVASHTGAAVYLLRMLYCCAMAGIAGASMTFVSKRVPAERIGELVGMLGTSGFLGIVSGNVLGDLLLGSVSVNRNQVTQMFVAAGVLGVLSFPFAWLATRAEPPTQPAARPPLFVMLRRYNPGPVLVVGVAMGMGLGLPGVFLRTYAAQLDIPRIGLFFMAYAGAGVVARVATRRWPERFGPRPIILAGVGGLAVSMALFLPVHSEWLLVLPAVGFGFSHAVLFPAVMAAGSVAFPARHRGLATVLVLAMCDLGQLVGAPAAGAVLNYSQLAGLPPYPTMFLAMAGVLALSGGWYAVVGRGNGSQG